MILKITAKPLEKSKYAVGLYDCIKVVDIETGQDITKGLKSVEIFIGTGEIATAKLEYYMSEVELDGVQIMVDKVKEHIDD